LSALSPLVPSLPTLLARCRLAEAPYGPITLL
jgi:hypothetical protein